VQMGFFLSFEPLRESRCQEGNPGRDRHRCALVGFSTYAGSCLAQANGRGADVQDAGAERLALVRRSV